MAQQKITNTDMDWDDLISSRGSESGLRDDLLASLRAHNALPFLFIGSGLSRRYLGLPDWEGMLRLFADEIGVDLDYLLASANGHLPSAASMLAKEFHPVWFRERKYRKQRDVHKDAVRDDEAALKVAVAEYMREMSPLTAGVPGVDDNVYALEIGRLGEAVVDGVITTNYDLLSDQLFPDFEAYVGQDDLLLSDAQFVAETYKIHGSCEEPSTLVLTARDYDHFTERNSYLAAKLLTIFAEHPVLFLGYSLSDQYIRQIVESIARAVGPSRLDALQERIYFIEWNSDAVTTPTISQYFLEVMPGQALPVKKVETHSFLPVFDALARLERPFPARVLRELRKYVFDLVTHPDPDHARETVRAVPLDSDEAGDLRVVFGVGSFSDEDVDDISAIGFRALTRDDLARDLLGIRSRGLDARNVLHTALPDMLRVAPTAYLPVVKYVAECDLIGAGGKITTAGLPDNVKKLIRRTPAPTSGNRKRFEKQFRETLLSPRAVFESDLAQYFKFEALLCLDPSTYDIEELRQVLAEEFDAPVNAQGNNRTHMFKAIAHYDRLRWGRPR